MRWSTTRFGTVIKSASFGFVRERLDMIESCPQKDAIRCTAFHWDRAADPVGIICRSLVYSFSFHGRKGLSRQVDSLGTLHHWIDFGLIAGLILISIR